MPEKVVIRFIYLLLKTGEPVTPDRLERLLEDLAGMPHEVRDRFDIPELHRYALDAATRLAEAA